MDPITIAMLGMSALNMMQNQEKEKRQTELASATQRYSPWTGLRAQAIEAANPYGDLAQGGAAALGYEQNKESAEMRKKLVDAQISALNRGSLNSTSSPMMAAPQSRGYWFNRYNQPLGASEDFMGY